MVLRYRAMDKKPPSYLVYAALACGVLYYVLELSSSGRTFVDFTVIALVVGAITWNLVQLGRRLNECFGGKAVWHLQRTVLFWIVGLMNTALLRPEHEGSWRVWVGWVILMLAALDTIALFRKEQTAISTATPQPQESNG